VDVGKRLKAALPVIGSLPSCLGFHLQFHSHSAGNLYLRTAGSWPYQLLSTISFLLLLQSHLQGAGSLENKNPISLQETQGQRRARLVQVSSHSRDELQT
jgi:hypothetical protein